MNSLLSTAIPIGVDINIEVHAQISVMYIFFYLSNYKTILIQSFSEDVPKHKQSYVSEGCLN